MLTIVFLESDQALDQYTSIDISVSEYIYKKLSEIGLGRLPYENKELNIDEEQVKIKVVTLRSNNIRNILKLKIESIRQQELERAFESVDVENITIKEIREYFSYIEELTSMYKCLSNENIHYLSIDA
jgi:hypothetical protein